MKIVLELLINHIKNWNMVWFGLIFWGSIFNALAGKLGLLATSPNLTFLSFFIGFILGLIAKYRGTWLWTPAR
tara:strand:+ start:624 stop:842 length:219 start_codon:yes stop_codon:yes gene_type:complete